MSESNECDVKKSWGQYENYNLIDRNIFWILGIETEIKSGGNIPDNIKHISRPLLEKALTSLKNVKVRVPDLMESASGMISKAFLDSANSFISENKEFITCVSFGLGRVQLLLLDLKSEAEIGIMALESGSYPRTAGLTHIYATEDQALNLMERAFQKFSAGDVELHIDTELKYHRV